MKVNPESLSYFRRFPSRRKLQGEDLISYQLTSYLIEMTLTNKCQANWTKIAHEMPKGSLLFGKRLRNMGKLAGVPDFVFTWKENHLWLELKKPKGKMSPEQKFFQKWCKETESNHAIAYSLEEAITILQEYDIIRK